MSDVSPPPVEWKYDYVQTGKPADAVEGESWYDMDDDRALVFTDNSGGTRELTVTEHAQLAGITRDAHHNPVTVEGPLRLSSGQVLDLAAADGLTLDANGKLRVASNAVTPSMLSFDPATQTELNEHASDADAHHAPVSINSENGSGTVNIGGQSRETRTFQFAETYTDCVVNVGVTYDYNSMENPPNVRWESWVTDANGDITGFNARFSNRQEFANDFDYSWNAMGETV